MSYLDDVFGEDGLLAARFPGYAPRKGQVDMARSVDLAFEKGRALAAEGPTGTGKSLAYLVPATYHAAKHGRRVLVVTANIALQEQLCVAPTEEVLTADLQHIPAASVVAGMKLLAFDEERVGHRRRFRESYVVSVSVVRKPCFRFVFDDGTSVVCSHDHLWLCSRGPAVMWRKASAMHAPRGKKPGTAVIRLTDTWDADRSYEAGYLAAAVDGEGWLSQKASAQYNGFTTKLGFSQNRNAMLDVVRGYLRATSFRFTEKRHGRDRCRRLEIYDRQEVLRFLGTYRPKRLLAAFDPEMLGTLPTGRRPRVVSKEDIGIREVVAITTTTKTLIVNGLASHNCNKDLPLLKSLLPWEVDFALLKGRSNYLCLDRLGEVESAGVLSTDPEVQGLREWAAETERGDVSELKTIPSRAAWARFSVGADDCKGKPCKFHGTCHAENARRAAKQARVIVANYHILFTHLAVRIATGKDLVLPPFDAVVCDEAHEAADIARDFFGWRVTHGTIQHAAKKLGSSDLRKALEEASGRYFDQLRAAKEARDYKARLRRPPAEPAAGALLELLSKACIVFESHRADHHAAGDKDGAAAWAVALKGAANAARRVGAATAAAGYAKTSNEVFFVELDEKGRPSLNAKQIDVAEALHSSLWAETRTSVLTSATITVGGTFEHLASETGLGRLGSFDQCVAESPFAWRDQALLVVPKDAVPEPNAPEFDQAAYRAVEASIVAASGRTLAIFTSNKRLGEAHARVRASAAVPWRVMRQGEAPRTQLVQAFHDDVSSVLMGTKSFWTGVDVQGEALSCVVIDRLPFPTPDDPIADVVAERNPNFFADFMIPRAVVALKQGFGRLVRTTTDRGAVVILDKRILTKGYGRTFLRSLPQCSMSTKIEDVAAFLEKETRT